MKPRRPAPLERNLIYAGLLLASRELELGHEGPSPPDRGFRLGDGTKRRQKLA